MKKINIAVLGCGRIGQMHARNVALHEMTSLACVYDINEEFASKVANDLGVSAVTNDQEIFANDNIDAILIASPTDTHIEFIEKYRSVNKPVLCENHIDLDISRVNESAGRLSRNNVPMQLGVNRSCDPGHQADEKSLLDGEIGNLHQCIITSRDPGIPSWDYLKVSGGQFRDMTIHDFDLARFMLGEEPVRVFALANALIEPKLKSDLNDRDTLMVIMETVSGKQCHINNSRSATYGYDQRVELFGSKGMTISDNRKPHEVRKFTTEFVDQQEPYLNFFIERYQEAYMNEITAFAEVVLNNSQPSVDFEDGRKALVLAETAYKSIKSGRIESVN